MNTFLENRNLEFFLWLTNRCDNILKYIMVRLTREQNTASSDTKKMKRDLPEKVRNKKFFQGLSEISSTV